jgi:hypothetical protein
VHLRAREYSHEVIILFRPYSNMTSMALNSRHISRHLLHLVNFLAALLHGNSSLIVSSPVMKVSFYTIYARREGVYLDICRASDV